MSRVYFVLCVTVISIITWSSNAAMTNPYGPVIKGLQAQYRPGQEIRASCSTGPYKPLPTLSWLINGKPPKSGTEEALTRNSQELETRTLTLTLKADKANFIKSVMNLTCVMQLSELSKRKTVTNLITLGVTTGADTFQSGSARLSVPAVVVSGQGFWLNCSAEGAHTFVWHKDNQPFYRDTPGAERSMMHQSPLGIYVNHTISRGGHVYMDTSDLDTEGNYMCRVILGEVRTRDLEKRVQVYVLPEGPPTIENVELISKMGDIVKARCISGPSKPGAILTWHVGSASTKAYNDNVTLEQNPAEEGRTFYSISTLSLLLEPSILSNGSQLLIICAAQVGTIYTKTSEHQITVLQPQEWALYYAGSGNASTSVVPCPLLCVGNLVALLAMLRKNGGVIRRHCD